MEINPIFKSFFFASWFWIILNGLVRQYTVVESGVVYAANGLLIALSLVLLCTLFYQWSVQSFIVGLSFLIIAIDNILWEASVVDETLYALDIGIGFFILSFLWCFVSHTTKPTTNREDHILFWLLLVSISLISVSVVMNSSGWIYVTILFLFLLVCVYLLSKIPSDVDNTLKQEKRLKWTLATMILFVLVTLRILFMYHLTTKTVMYWSVLVALVATWIIDMIRYRVYNKLPLE